VLQCVAVCCSVLQCEKGNTMLGMPFAEVADFLLFSKVCVVVYCSVLQRVAACCSVLQCVPVCCSVLQCIVVCCSVLQCEKGNTTLVHSNDRVDMVKKNHCNTLQHTATHIHYDYNGYMPTNSVVLPVVYKDFAANTSRCMACAHHLCDQRNTRTHMHTNTNTNARTHTHMYMLCVCFCV